MYFFGSAAKAAYYPYVILYFRSIGITGVDAGLILFAGFASVFTFAGSIGALADRSERARRVVILSGLSVAIAAMLCMSLARSVAACLVCAVVFEVAQSCIWPTLDASLLALLNATEGSVVAFGNTRAFGAAGWGVGAWVAGAILEVVGLSQMFYLVAVGCLPCFVSLALIPLERRVSMRSKHGMEFLWSFANLDAVLFLLNAFLLNTLLCIVDIFRSPLLAELGAPKSLLGLSVFMTAISEVPCFFIAKAVTRRFRVSAVMGAVLAVYALRYQYYALLEDPWWTIPAELVHGVTFAFSSAAATQHVSTFVGPERSSSAQGLLSAIQWGLAPAAGSAIGGAILDHEGARAVFQFSVFIALAGLVPAALAYVRQVRPACGAQSRLPQNPPEPVIAATEAGDGRQTVEGE